MLVPGATVEPGHRPRTWPPPGRERRPSTDLLLGAALPRPAHDEQRAVRLDHFAADVLEEAVWRVGRRGGMSGRTAWPELLSEGATRVAPALCPSLPGRL